MASDLFSERVVTFFVSSLTFLQIGDNPFTVLGCTDLTGQTAENELGVPVVDSVRVVMEKAVEFVAPEKS